MTTNIANKLADSRNNLLVAADVLHKLNAYLMVARTDGAKSIAAHLKHDESWVQEIVNDGGTACLSEYFLAIMHEPAIKDGKQAKTEIQNTAKRICEAENIRDITSLFPSWSQYKSDTARAIDKAVSNKVDRKSVSKMGGQKGDDTSIKGLALKKAPQEQGAHTLSDTLGMLGKVAKACKDSGVHKANTLPEMHNRLLALLESMNERVALEEAAEYIKAVKEHGHSEGKYTTSPLVQGKAAPEWNMTAAAEGLLNQAGLKPSDILPNGGKITVPMVRKAMKRAA